MKTCWMTTAFPAPTICAIVCVCVATAGGALSQTAPSPGQASAPAAPPPQMAPMCDGPCVQANMDRAAKACARPIEAQSPTDFEWLTRPFMGIFLEADKSSPQNAIVAYRGKSIRFQTTQKEWIRVVYQCEYDTAAQKVVAVRVRPGRLDRPPPARLSAAQPGKPATSGAQPPVRRRSRRHRQAAESWRPAAPRRSLEPDDQVRGA